MAAALLAVVLVPATASAESRTFTPASLNATSWAFGVTSLQVDHSDTVTVTLNRSGQAAPFEQVTVWLTTDASRASQQKIDEVASATQSGNDVAVSFSGAPAGSNAACTAAETFTQTPTQAVLTFPRACIGNADAVSVSTSLTIGTMTALVPSGPGEPAPHYAPGVAYTAPVPASPSPTPSASPTPAAPTAPPAPPVPAASPSATPSTSATPVLPTTSTRITLGTSRHRAVRGAKGAGKRAVLRARVTPETVAGSVRFYERRKRGLTLVATRVVHAGRALVRAPRSLPVGRHVFVATFSPASPDLATASTSKRVVVRIVRARTR